MQDCLLAIDQGTTSTRVLAFGLDRTILAEHQIALEQHYPASGWVEHDGEAIWADVQACLTHVLDALDGRARPLAIGITNQRETTLVWDRDTGVPAHRAIVWQDRRTADRCRQLRRNSGTEARVSDITGLVLDPYFSGTKLAWLLDDPNGPRLRSRADNLLFGTVESFLVYRLTGGRVHVSDATNASRTLMCGLENADWSDEMLDLLGIPAQMLPRITDCTGEVGLIADGLPGAGLPITGLAGDQQSATIGQACLNAGDIKSTYGTGCFLLLNTGDQIIRSTHKLLTTIAAQSGGQRTYAVEGSIFNAGTVVQWLRDGINLFDKAEDSEALARSVEDSGGVYMVPAFTGLGAPHWQPDARGIITGLTRSTERAHLVRAGLESVAFQTSDLLAALKADGADAPTRLRIDGGMANNGWFAQTLADVCGVEVERPQSVETTALGAALCAGVGAGVWPDLGATAAGWQGDARFAPSINDEKRSIRLEGWSRAVDQCLSGLDA